MTVASSVPRTVKTDNYAQAGKPVPVICVEDPAVARFDKVELDERFTVGMSAYGNVQTTLVALRALFNAARGPFELILVDDCSPDDGQIRGLFLQAAAEHRNTRVFGFERNLEYSGSLDCILSHARGDKVLFLSNDIFVTPAYLRGLIEAAEADPAHGVVRGCSNYVDNALATHNLAVPAINTSADLFEFGERVRSEWGRSVVYDDYLTGDAFMVTRAVLQKIGTFDPLFYGYFADHDFGVRARCAGFQLVLARGAFAYHLQASNFSYLPPEQQKAKLDRRWARVYENWARFKMKFGMPVEQMYESMAAVPWQQLNSEPFGPRHVCAPRNYSKYLLTSGL